MLNPLFDNRLTETRSIERRQSQLETCKATTEEPTFLLHCVCGAGGQNATRKSYQKESQAGSGCLAVSVVGKES